MISCKSLAALEVWSFYFHICFLSVRENCWTILLTLIRPLCLRKLLKAAPIFPCFFNIPRFCDTIGSGQWEIVFQNPSLCKVFCFALFFFFFSWLQVKAMLFCCVGSIIADSNWNERIGTIRAKVNKHLQSVMQISYRYGDKTCFSPKQMQFQARCSF